MLLRNGLILVFIRFTIVFSLTCNEILELPDDAVLSLQQLQSIPPKEIIKCLAHLGRQEIGKSEAEFIWNSLKTFYEGIGNIPDSILILLHWVTPAVTPQDYNNITLSDIDIIQNFGLNYNLVPAQLSAIADRVREDFAGKEPEDYTYYDLTALKQILCAFNRSEIERIHPSVYREAALIVGKLKECDVEVMLGFATLAVQKSAFGPPENWSDVTREIVGTVGKYVPQKDMKIEIKDERESSQSN